MKNWQPRPIKVRAIPPIRQKKVEWMGRGAVVRQQNRQETYSCSLFPVLPLFEGNRRIAREKRVFLEVLVVALGVVVAIVGAATLGAG